MSDGVACKTGLFEENQDGQRYKNLGRNVMINSVWSSFDKGFCSEMFSLLYYF